MPGPFPGLDEGVLQDIFGVAFAPGLLSGEQQESVGVFIKPELPVVVMGGHGMGNNLSA